MQRAAINVLEQCLKFKTNSSIFLNRFENLNLSLMQKMQNYKPPSALAAASDLSPPAENVRGMSPVPPQAAATLPTASTAGGVKKKKPKKKK